MGGGGIYKHHSVCLLIGPVSTFPPLQKKADNPDPYNFKGDKLVVQDRGILL